VRFRQRGVGPAVSDLLWGFGAVEQAGPTEAAVDSSSLGAATEAASRCEGAVASGDLVQAGLWFRKQVRFRQVLWFSQGVPFRLVVWFG
jgi:hypothetical protein